MRSGNCVSLLYYFNFYMTLYSNILNSDYADIIPINLEAYLI